MMTEIVIGYESRGLLGFVEHKVHDDHDGGPKEDLLVPEQHFVIVFQNSAEEQDPADDAVPERGILDGSIRPDRNAAEINQEWDDIDFESAADRQKHLQKPEEHQRGPDH